MIIWSSCSWCKKPPPSFILLEFVTLRWGDHHNFGTLCQVLVVNRYRIFSTVVEMEGHHAKHFWKLVGWKPARGRTGCYWSRHSFIFWMIFVRANVSPVGGLCYYGAPSQEFALWCGLGLSVLLCDISPGFNNSSFFFLCLCIISCRFMGLGIWIFAASLLIINSSQASMFLEAASGAGSNIVCLFVFVCNFHWCHYS